MKDKSQVWILVFLVVVLGFVLMRTRRERLCAPPPKTPEQGAADCAATGSVWNEATKSCQCPNGTL